MDSENLILSGCPVAKGISRLGDAWSMLILRDASRGMKRFDQFRTSLGIAPNILTRRLSDLTADGILERRRYSERPPRDEYVLTQAGIEFLPILALIGDWACKQPGGDKLRRIIDADTGELIKLELVDAKTGKSIEGRRLTLVDPS
ncbi:MAG: helix-turn-helix domain-containing protein [Aestuariivirga sp.]